MTGRKYCQEDQPGLEKFLEDLKPYQEWAEQDGLEWMLHLFIDQTDDWTANVQGAYEWFYLMVKQKIPARVYVELYVDREKDIMKHEDCLLSYGRLPF